MNFNNIIILSPPRTGSTLVYNIFKSVFTDKVITKTHEFVYNTNDLFVVTVRHPYNCILSILMCNEKTTEPVNNNNNITDATNNFMKCGGKDYINNNQIIFDNLFEFFLQRKCNKIKTFSDYEWISGFVFWNSLMFDIPLINMANSNTFIKSICNNSNIIIPKNVTIINDTSMYDLNQPKIKSAEFDLHSSQSIPSKEIQFVPDEKNNQSEQLILSVIGSNAEKYNTNTLPNITILQTENTIKNDGNVEYNIINDTDNSSLTQQTVQFSPKLLNFSYSIIDEKVQKNGLNVDNANKLKSTRNVKTPVKIIRKNLNMSYI